MMRQEFNLQKYLRQDRKPQITPYQFMMKGGYDGIAALDVFKKAEETKNCFIALISYPPYSGFIDKDELKESIRILLQYHYPKIQKEDIDFYELNLLNSQISGR